MIPFGDIPYTNMYGESRARKDIRGPGYIADYYRGHQGKTRSLDYGSLGRGIPENQEYSHKESRV